MPDPPNSPNPELRAAEALLRGHGGYEWLFLGQKIWSVKQVAQAMALSGLSVSDDAVWRWFRQMPHTQDFGGPIGLRASRDDLVLWFAHHFIEGGKRHDG